MSVKAWTWAFIAACLLFAGGLVAWRFIGPGLDRARAERETALDDAKGRGLEVDGGRVVSDAQAKAQADLDAQRKTADDLNRQAQSDPNARAPLPDSVRDRIRAGDGELCKSARCR